MVSVNERNLKNGLSNYLFCATRIFSGFCIILLTKFFYYPTFKNVFKTVLLHRSGIHKFNLRAQPLVMTCSWMLQSVCKTFFI